MNRFVAVTQIIFLFLWSAAASHAQSKEFGLQVGVAQYLGDLAPSVSLGETNEFLCGFYQKNSNTGFFSWKFAGSYGRISGSDANFKDNSLRNLNFRSILVEGSLQFEFNFQKFLIGLRAEKFSPYVFTGIGLTYYNPQGELNGTWHDLRPLSTEGQGIGGPRTYSTITPVIPIGGGVKWYIGKQWNFGVFAGYRYSFSDYLDDVSGTYFDNATIFERKGDIAAQLADKSLEQFGFDGNQRGNPDRNDWYVFFGCSISYWISDRICYNFQ